MTLSGVVLFPQAMLPLHIFELRYRQMLQDVLEDPDALIDLAAFSLCPDTVEKQRLLETLETNSRYEKYLAYLQEENEQLILETRLRGGLSRDDVSRN